MAYKSGLATEAAANYQKTEVFDTAGNFTWTHPLPGQNIEVFVQLFGAGGGGGGGASDAIGVDATDGIAGGNTIWDTGGSNDTALGGSEGLGGQDTVDFGNRHATQSYLISPRGTGGSSGGTSNNFITDNGTSYGKAGFHGYGSGYAGGLGGIGFIKKFNAITNGDVNLTVGAAGTGGARQVGGSPTNSDGTDGGIGAVILSYNITTTQTPVVVNLQRRDWEHFGEVSWRADGTTNAQSIINNTLTVLTLDHKRLDTGSKIDLIGSNQFTLQAGTYEIDIRFPLATESTNGDVWGMLYNFSDSAVEISANLTNDGNSSGNNHNYTTSGILVVPSQKTFELKLIHGDTVGARGFGKDVNESYSTSDLFDRTKFQFKWRP